jgi:hypothetical protein
VTQEPANQFEPHWSPDRLWWWDGARWIPASQVPVTPIPPPPPPPPAYTYLAPAYAYTAPTPLAPSPGLRTFLIIALAVDVAATGFMSLFGLLGISSGGVSDAGELLFWLIFVVLLALAVTALVGVIVRAAWARWVALAAGIAVSLTCLGLIVGIPIIVAAARAPLPRRQAPSSEPA